MTIGSLGEIIKSNRLAKNWSQELVAIKSGLDRNYIKAVESGQIKKPRPDKLRKIAEALNISYGELFSAVGYEVPGETIKLHRETPEELLERLKLVQPISIPVYRKFHFGAEHEEPIEYVYYSRSKATSKNVEAFLVNGSCLSPKVEHGDIVIVDRDRQPQRNNILICIIEDEVVVGRYDSIDGVPYLINNEEKVKITDCRACAVVIKIQKDAV